MSLRLLVVALIAVGCHAAIAADRLLVGGVIPSSTALTVAAGAKLTGGTVSYDPAQKTLTVMTSTQRLTQTLDPSGATTLPLAAFASTFGFVHTQLGQRYFNCVELTRGDGSGAVYYHPGLEQGIADFRRIAGRRVYDSKEKPYAVRGLTVSWPSLPEALDINTPETVYLLDPRIAERLDDAAFAPTFTVTLDDGNGRILKQDFTDFHSFQAAWRLYAPAEETALQRARQQADAAARTAAIAARKKQLAELMRTHPKWKPAMVEQAVNSRIAIGMPADLARVAWGEPMSIKRTVTRKIRHEKWLYPGGQYVQFENGYVTSWGN